MVIIKYTKPLNNDKTKSNKRDFNKNWSMIYYII